MTTEKTRRKKGRKEKRRQELISWRRNMIVEQTSKGRTQREIAKILRVGIGTVNRDLFWFREKAKEDNENFIEKIQEEHEKSMIGLKAVLKETWFIIENAEDNKEKLAALSLAKDCYTLQEDLICNLPIIDEVLKLDSEGQEMEGPHAATGEEGTEEEEQTLTEAEAKEGQEEKDDDDEGKEKEKEKEKEKCV